MGFMPENIIQIKLSLLRGAVPMLPRYAGIIPIHQATFFTPIGTFHQNMN